MRKLFMSIALTSLGILSAASLVHAQATTAPMTIKEATATCERDVPENCVTTTCPAYCDTLRSTAQKEKCKSDCTKDKRCKLKPLAGNDDPMNAALDADNRDKLIGCIAQMRDPEGKKTGRREGNWQDLTTPSMEKALGKR